MAEAFVNHSYADAFRAFSAGTVATRVDPRVITVMEELGIDMSAHRSKFLEEFTGQTFDIVITVCDAAGQQCPFFHGAKNNYTSRYLIHLT